MTRRRLRNQHQKRQISPTFISDRSLLSSTEMFDATEVWMVFGVSHTGIYWPGYVVCLVSRHVFGPKIHFVETAVRNKIELNIKRRVTILTKSNIICLIRGRSGRGNTGKKGPVERAKVIRKEKRVSMKDNNNCGRKHVFPM